MAPAGVGPHGQYLNPRGLRRRGVRLRRGRVRRTSIPPRGTSRPGLDPSQRRTRRGIGPLRPHLRTRRARRGVSSRTGRFMEDGEIDQLSDQINGMMHQLLMSAPRVQQRQNGRQQGGARGNNSRHRPRQQPAQQEKKPRPYCTYSKCDKPVGHWEATYFRKGKDNDTRPRRPSGGPKWDRSPFPHANRRYRGRHNDDNDDSQAGSGHEDSRGPAGVALSTVGTHPATNVVGKVSAIKEETLRSSSGY